MACGDLRAALRTLSEGQVQFIVVGGVASVLNGAPVNTFDFEIVPSRDEENVARLLRVLDVVDAIYREPTRRITPDASHLSSPGHQNLTTKYGPFDVLGTIGRGLSYEGLLPHTVEMDIGDGVRVRVLDLETIIAIKEELGTEKDLAVLPLLRRTLKEKQGR
jgi:hypothetical protein